MEKKEKGNMRKWREIGIKVHEKEKGKSNKVN
jgi:hypothetical protein